jgi:EAL domain-containing protein (putative c-di-GMP-specific phosphodiesterase class I)
MHRAERHPSATTARQSADRTIEYVLSTGAVRMLFQPIVRLDSGSAVAFEALVRPRRGAASAADILGAATRSNSLGALDRLAHSIAFASAGYLASESKLFINASPASVVERGFAIRMARLAALADVPSSRVVVEITELGAPADDARLRESVESLRALGFGIALDDVGAGQSDLSRILRLRPGWIKLDRALVQALPTDRYGRSLVAALTRFAAHNSIRVVAEGIELPSQARAAADLGISLAQGFWFAHPLPLADAHSGTCAARVQRRWRAVAAAA